MFFFSLCYEPGNIPDISYVVRLGPEYIDVKDSCSGLTMDMVHE